MSLHAVVSLPNGLLAYRETSCFCETCFRDGQFHMCLESDCGWHSSAKPVDSVDSADSSGGTRPTALNRPSPPIPTPSASDCEVNPPDQNTGLATDHANGSAQQVVSPITASAYTVGHFVVAEYEGQWYIGNIVKVDEEPLEYQVSFLRQTTKTDNHFKWPSPLDKLWVYPNQILTTIDSPKKCGKSGRFYEIPIEVIQWIES